MADLIAPSLALGLAIGRVGCLMNGCCYGGPCSYPWAITFPPHSPPYSEQTADGTFLGIGFAEPADAAMGVVVARVTADSVADAAGITANARIVSLDGYEVNSLDNVKSVLSRATSEVAVTLDSGRSIVLANPRPQRSLPIHPTQVYSALNATLLCLFALALYPFRHRDGQVIAMLLTLYAITRFLLEVIRTDEGSFGGTGLTISQNVSVLMAVGLAVLWASIYLRPAKLAWPRKA
ncbi:MAG: prolipoprotein diacylglyceryl transferase [Pirellulaceae bacterium]